MKKVVDVLYLVHWREKCVELKTSIAKSVGKVLARASIHNVPDAQSQKIQN